MYLSNLSFTKGKANLHTKITVVTRVNKKASHWEMVKLGHPTTVLCYPHFIRWS